MNTQLRNIKKGDYLNALNAIMDALKLAGAFVCAHDEEDDDFVITYVHIK